MLRPLLVPYYILSRGTYCEIVYLERLNARLAERHAALECF